MSTIKILIVMFIISSVYGFTFNHFIADNKRNSVFAEQLSKRISGFSLYKYLAFSDWLKDIESRKTTNQDEDTIDQDWYTTVIENIRKEEYNITYNREYCTYQSPNRANNYRFIYYKDGFSVMPRQTKIPLFDESDENIEEKDKKYKMIKDWMITMRLYSFGKKDHMKSFEGDNLKVNKNTAYIEDDNLSINYTNCAEGMQQDFIVKRKPGGAGNLKVQINADTKLETEIGTEEIFFSNGKGDEVMKYNSLKIWDSKEKVLEGWFEEVPSDLSSNYGRNTFNIVVNDENAVYPITIDPLSSSANWTVESKQADTWFGSSVSSAGDVNGDGYGDVIVGARFYDNGESDEGLAFVYHGSPGGLSSKADWTAESNQVNAYFGWSVSAAGDVNGDGYSDVIVGVYSGDNGEKDEGMAFVYYGSSSGLSATANWTAESNQMNAHFGRSVSTAGDVNGDGYSDVIIGADSYSNGQIDEGRVFVFHGSASGLSKTPNWTAESNQENAYFGWSVSAAGDVNGDSYSDVIVGSLLYDNGQTDEGGAFVWYGSSSGLGANGTPSNADWTAESNQESAYYGCSVSTGGDVNGDGYSDVIVGAWYYENGQSNEGGAFVYHGSPKGLSEIADWTAESNQSSARFGYSISTAGDVNDDGYSDAIVGAFYYSEGEYREGKVFVYYGSPRGLSLTADWTSKSNQWRAYFGYSVSTAGDVNGDGCSDMIVGINSYDNEQITDGKVCVYFGSAERKVSLKTYGFEKDLSSINK